MEDDLEPQERCHTLENLQTYFPHALKCSPESSPGQNQSYFRSVLKHMESNDFLRTLLTEQQIYEVEEMLDRIDQYDFSFQTKFLSILVFWRQRSFNKASVTMLYLNLKKTKVMINHGQMIEYQDEYETCGEYSLGVESTHRALSILTEQIENSIQETIQKYKSEKKKQGYQYSPSFLKQIVLKKMSNLSQQDEDDEEEQSLNKNKKEEEEMKIQKMGTANFQYLHVPGLDNHFSLCLLSYLLQDQELARIILFSFRIEKLRSWLSVLTSFDRSHIEASKQCLKQLFLEYKRIYNLKIQISKEIITQFFDNSNKIIENVVNKGLTANPIKITTEQLVQSVKLQLQENKPISINNIVQLKKFTQNKKQGNTQIGFTTSAKVDQSILFTELFYLRSELSNQHYWISEVQRHFSIISNKLEDEKFLNNLKDSQFSCQVNGFSPLHKVVNQYDNLLNNPDKNKHYTNTHLSMELFSHIYLIKMVAAALAFQKYKFCNRETGFKVDQYRVSLQKLGSIYEYFTSMSFDMRNTLNNLMNYAQKNDVKKNVLFKLGSKDSYNTYFGTYFDNSTICQNLLKSWEQQLNKEIKILQDRFKNFGVRLAQAESKEQRILLNQKCQDIKPINNFYYGTQKCICNYCKKLQQIRAQINRIKSQQFNDITTYISQNTAENKSMVVMRINQGRGFLTGLMKIVYESQVTIFNKAEYSSYNTHKLQTSKPINYICPQVNPQTYNLITHYKQKADAFVEYSSGHSMWYYNFNNVQPVQNELFDLNRYIHPNQQLKFILQKPRNQNYSRQHNIYANFSTKKKCNLKQFKKLNQQMYTDFASIKVAPYTQIPILCDFILSRSFKLNTCDIHEFQRLCFLMTAGDAKAYKMINYKDNGCFKYASEPFTITSESIKQLLKQYAAKWRYDDFLSIQIYGPILALFAKLAEEPEFMADIIISIFEYFQSIQKELINDSGYRTKLKLLWIIRSIMHLFWEDVCQDQRLATIFAKIMLFSKLNQRYINIPEQFNIHKSTILTYSWYFNRAIYINIASAVENFKKNLNFLTEVVKSVDQDISNQTQWTFIEDQSYVFQGIDGQEQYKINLFTGLYLKNGNTLSKLPTLIKNNPQVLQIFSKNADLEVSIRRNGAYRTSQSFHRYFPQEKDTQVFFQFSLSQSASLFQQKSNVKIKLIFKHEDQQISYILISPTEIMSIDVFIPSEYLRSYYCWLNQENNSLIFRKKNIDNINIIGLVLLANKQSIFQGRIITEQFRNKSMKELIDLEHSLFFERLFIVHKNKRDNKAIDILSAIELPEFIIQILSMGSNSNIQFWFIRSNTNIKFLFDVEKGLVSLNYEGYRVNQEYRHHLKLPWSQLDEVNCLMLTKMGQNFKNCMNNQNMVLMPFNKVGKNGRTLFSTDYQLRTQIYQYFIHDNFLDFRSRNKTAQLFAACMVSSFQGKIVSPTLSLNNQEYALSLLRACYSNLPLTTKQTQIFDNLTKLAEMLGHTSLLLCCQVLFRASTCINFDIDYGQSYLSSQLLQGCKVVYQQQLNDEINCKNRLTEFEFRFLGMDYHKISMISKKNSKLYWNKEQMLTINIEEKQQKSIKSSINAYTKAVKDLDHVRNTIFKYFSKKEQQEKEQEDECLAIPDLAKGDEMPQQMMADLKSSYQSFLRYDVKYERIEIDQLKTVQLLITLFTAPLKKCIKLKQELEDKIDSIFTKHQKHLEYMFRRKEKLSFVDFTAVMCEKDKLTKLYPGMKKQHVQLIQEAVKYWFLITLQIQSLTRTLCILKEQYIDKTALFRQLLSPRAEITQKNHWISFEAQMRIRIWRSQVDTYNHLIEKGNGSVAQLNMGQGKTQVINPMIVLENIYNSQINLTRINILSSLYNEAESNYFRFFSVTSFRIPLFRLRFNRKVPINQKTLNNIKESLHFFKDKVLILQDRQSTLSMILKERQEYLNKNPEIKKIGKQKRDQWIFCGLIVFDIFDEVDALMTPKKFFVYSIGNNEALKSDRIRFEVARVIMEVFCQQMFEDLYNSKMIVADQPLEKCLRIIKEGSYPSGTRFLSKISQDQRIKMRKKIVTTIMENDRYQISYFQFYITLTNQCQKELLIYLVDGSSNNIESIRSSLPQDLNAILALRGMLGFGIFQHCLGMRAGVDFGVPCDHQSGKRVGVPYEAADNPSKSSEYAHPDLSIFISYVSYYTKGISYDEFTEAIQKLLNEPDSTQKFYFDQMLHTIRDESLRPKNVTEPRQINLDSNAQLQSLYDCFKKCRSTIAYWLSSCVFPDDLKQYYQSISSSSWDLSYVEDSVGYSGTKDSRWLLPHRLKWQPSPSDIINGTDGKMIQMMLHHTIEIGQIKQGKESLWQRLCIQALELIKEGVGCIIDAGAVLVGKSLEDEIVPWISSHQLFGGSKYFKGITFCDASGKWKVYDINTLSIVQRHNSIAEQQTFVIFDEARTRGADIMMKTNIKAVVTLAPKMTKDKLMQAVGRLRKFGRKQEIYILGTPEILNNIEQIKNKSGKQRIAGLIKWSCQNSLDDNFSLMHPNSKLAMIHFKTITSGKPQIQEFPTALPDMYTGEITEESLHRIFQITISKVDKNISEHKEVKKLGEHMNLYGKNHKVRGHNLDDACERQTQTQNQVQNIQQKENDSLEPIPETEPLLQLNQGPISTLNFKFDSKLFFTRNFIQCTKYKSQAINQVCNQLCKIFYVLIDKKGIIVISQLQACKLLSNGHKSCGPYGLNYYSLRDGPVLCRFKDLKMTIPLMVELQFETALAHAQFFNGFQTFEGMEAQKILFEFLVLHKKQQNIKRKQNTGRIVPNSGSIFGNIKALNLFQNTFQTSRNIQDRSESKDQNDFYGLTCHFLKRRNTVYSKYMNSDLQKIEVALVNLPLRQWESIIQ